jgi:outer membrane receptor protein involved in Fe transport
MEMGRIDVVGTTPLPGLGTPLADVPANVQTFGGRDFDRQRPPSVPSFLERNAAAVAINAAQGNPFQPDISYRGFTASPLLGTPQGIAVFQDGVRVNEPFGDIMNWDLIPPNAIEAIQLVPGVSAAYGPNTLGAALAVYTKSGDENPGGMLDLLGGSWARKSATFEQGGSHGPWDYYVTADALDDDGWAMHNPSKVRRLFAKGGHQTGNTDLDVSLTLARNTLEGTQTLPVSFFDDIRQPYTFPDHNTNKLAFLSGKGSTFLSDHALLGGTAYWRHYRNDSFASDANEVGGGDDADQPPAVNDRSEIDQRSYGLGLQLTLESTPGGHNNRLVTGASYDHAATRFTRFSQPADFTPERGTVATGDFTLDTDADTTLEQQAIFVTDAFAISDAWLLTLGGRYQVSRVRIADRTGTDPGLDGDNRFSKFTPAVGLNFKPRPSLTAYASYTQSMRAPTPVELTCADPGAPCKLPNEFISDPPLRPVVSDTYEIGARGHLAEATGWSAAIFRTDLTDDIQFVRSGSASTAGFFQNVGKTRREGVELTAMGRAGPVDLALRYGYIRATFLSSFLEASPNNSTADADGAILVQPGNHLTAIPQHTVKLRADYAHGPWSFGASVVGASWSYARGDENNQDAGGRVPGYVVVNLDGRWKVWRGLEIYGQVENVFNVKYATLGVLGQNLFDSPDRTYAPQNAHPEQFRGPGLPFGAWVGVRYAWK